MKPLRTSLVLLLALIIAAAALAGCSNKDVAAKVNGDVITKAQLEAQVAQLKKQYPQMFQGPDGEGRLIDFKKRLLDNLINQKLIQQAAKERGVKVTDADVQKQVDQLRQGFKDQAQFDQALKSAGMTADTLKQQISDQLMTQKLIESLSNDVKISAADVKAYYEKNKAQFYQKPAKRASHILFKPEDKKTAAKVLAELEGGADFATLAKKYSVDTATASKGGDLGWPSTPYVAEFQKALDKLKKGETSALVQTPYGWHIIRVTDTRSGKQESLTEATKSIEQMLVQQRRADSYQTFLDGLRKKAKIEILIPELKDGAAAKTGSAATSGTAK